MRIESKQSAPDEAEGFRPARFCAEGGAAGAAELNMLRSAKKGRILRPETRLIYRMFSSVSRMDSTCRMASSTCACALRMRRCTMTSATKPSMK